MYVFNLFLSKLITYQHFHAASVSRLEGKVPFLLSPFYFFAKHMSDNWSYGVLGKSTKTIF